MKLFQVLLLSHAVAVCLVSAADAFLPSTHVCSVSNSNNPIINAGLSQQTWCRGGSTATSPSSLFVGKNKNRNVNDNHPNNNNENSKHSSPKPNFVSYQETDVRLYQSSTSFDPSSSSTTSLSNSAAAVSPTAPAVPSSSTETPSSSSSSRRLDQLVNTATNSPLVQALASSTLFVFMNIIIQRTFHATSIKFPSSLAGCMALASSMLVAPNHQQLYKVLGPGAKLLQKFLMVFLVPNLIVLPLCDGCGSISEVAKVFSIIFGGFLFSLLSTAGSVVAIRKYSTTSKYQQLQQQQQQSVIPTSTTSSPTKSTTTTNTKPKAFSDELTVGTRYAAALTGLAAVGAHAVGHPVTSPLLACSMLTATVHNFCMGARWPKKVTKIFHPLVTCTALTWVWAALLGVGTSTSFLNMIRSYRVGGPLQFATSGAGDVLTFLLGPAVVSLGVSIYERRNLIRQNWKEVLASTGISVVGGLFGTAAMVRVLAIASAELRLSLLPRNITSALAVAIAEIVGANKSFAVSFAVITGLIGANWGAGLLNAFGIKDPVARGLGIGSAAHGLGTAAFVDEKDAFPFAAISMALTAIFGTVFVSIPAVKRVAIQLALGGSIPV